MLAAEGHVHKRQRRVATPAFSVQNMRALVPLVFNKGEELKDRWMGLIQEQAIDNSQENPIGIRLDVCHWISRATFDVIGLAGGFPRRFSHRLSAYDAAHIFRI
jgi:cytochrome P450